jgi:hypothetical protein
MFPTRNTAQKMKDGARMRRGYGSTTKKGVNEDGGGEP